MLNLLDSLYRASGALITAKAKGNMHYPGADNCRTLKNSVLRLMTRTEIVLSSAFLTNRC